LVCRRGRHVSPKGPSSNAWIVTKGGKVVTRPADNGILRGITRTVLIEAHRGPRPAIRGTAVYGRGGARGARGLPDLCQPNRNACRPDRRPTGGERRAWVGGDRATGPNSIATPNGADPPICPRRRHSAPNLCLRRPRTCPVMAGPGPFVGAA
jgi:hypothetical protein